MGLDDDTHLEPQGQGSWSGHIRQGWSTPRGALGGYVMAVVLHALELAVDDPRRQPRSVTVHFARSPELAPVQLRANVERSGRSLTTVSGRLEQDGALLAVALGAFSVAWESPRLDGPAMPAVEPPTARTVAVSRLAGGGRASFVERLTMERRLGDLPFTQSRDLDVGGWLGLRETRPIDARTSAVLADAWYPAVWPRLEVHAGAPTLELTVHFRAPLPLPDSLLLGRFRTTTLRDGFFEEDGEMWAPDGTLVAQSRQLGLLLGER